MKRARIIQKKAIDTEQDPYLRQIIHEGLAVCKICGAVYNDKHWTLKEDFHVDLADKEPVEITCPACRKIHDNFAEGYVILQGDFLFEHKEEILNLIKNKEARSMRINPLHRIIETKERGGRIELTTTTEKLAQMIGRVLKKTYGGTVEYKWSADVKLARVIWSRAEEIK